MPGSSAGTSTPAPGPISTRLARIVPSCSVLPGACQTPVTTVTLLAGAGFTTASKERVLHFSFPWMNRVQFNTLFIFAAFQFFKK